MLRSAGRWTLADRFLLVSAVLTAVHYADHLLRMERELWPPRLAVVPLALGLLIYPLLFNDPLHLRERPWLRVALGTILVFSLFTGHVIDGSPADQYNAWVSGEVMGISSPVLGLISVHLVIILLAVAVFSLLLLIRDALRSSTRRSQVGSMGGSDEPVDGRPR